MCNHTSTISFRKATASGNNQSGPNCVEVGAFMKASASVPHGACVEVAPFVKARKSNPSGNCVEVSYAKATASGAAGHCVEVAYAKATRSGAAGHCVEVAHAKASASSAVDYCVEPGQATHAHNACTPETCETPGIEPGDIVVRDSKAGEGSPLAVFKAGEWEAIVARVAAADDADFNDATPEVPWFIADPRTGVVLRFNEGEWDAFRDGCAKHEFDYAPLTSVPA